MADTATPETSKNAAVARNFFGPEGRLNRLIPERWRRYSFRIGITVYLVIMLAFGTFFNVRLYRERIRLQTQVERDERSLSQLPAIRQQIQTERAANSDLTMERDHLYAGVPDLSNIPIITDQLEQLATMAGGRLTSLDYIARDWQNNRSEVMINLIMEGSFPTIVSYIAGVSDSFSTARIQQATINPVENSSAESGRLALEMALAIVALEKRPEAYPLWDEMRLVARVMEPISSPFEPPFHIWSIGNSLGLDLPDWSLTGIVENDGVRRAFLNVNGRTYVVRTGDWVNDVEITAIRDKYIEARMDGRAALIRLEGR